MARFHLHLLASAALLVACGTATTASSTADAELDVYAAETGGGVDVPDSMDVDAAPDVAPDVAVTDADAQLGFDAVADVPDVAAPDVAQPDAAADVADTAAAADALDAADTVGMNVCQKLGGICASSASDCTTGGGTYQSAGDSGCVFDDGPGACCIPPKMTQAKATCADFGGICAPISGCNFVQGAYAAYEGCKGIPMICCVPHDICGDEHDSCCNDMTTYRTACDHGEWICTIDGTVKKPTDQCPK